MTRSYIATFGIDHGEPDKTVLSEIEPAYSFRNVEVPALAPNSLYPLLERHAAVLTRDYVGNPQTGMVHAGLVKIVDPETNKTLRAPRRISAHMNTGTYVLQFAS